MNSSKVVGAGIFVVVGLLLFTVGIFMIGARRNLFSDRSTIYTEFSTLGQLEMGATVRVSGLDAGEVTDIQIPPKPGGKFKVKMELRDDLRPLIRTDSVATSQTEGLVGAVFINIGGGTEQAPQVPDDGIVPSREPLLLSDIMEQMSGTVKLVHETVEALRGDIEKTVQVLALTVEDTHALIEDIRPDLTAIAENGNRLSNDARLLVAGLNNGEGTIGKLLKDDTLYVRVQEITDEAKVVMANIKEVSTEARRAISDFRSPDGPALGLMGDMRQTLGQAREATSDLADNMEAMKHNFLLRGFFNKRGYFDLDAISPSDYRKGVLENGKRKAMRIWLSAAVLFEPGPDGAEQLSADGRARIDSAMATYLKYLPANPLVVEGYATAGIAGDRYRLSRIRSGIVRDYLMGRYQLLPQHTGYIALAEDAEGSPGDAPWDGVALTLFMDQKELEFAAQQVATAVPEVAPVLEDQRR